MKKISAESFGDNLALKLKEVGMTQRELAKKTGLREATISKYINGQWIPKIDVFCTICNALNAKPKHLLAYPLYVKNKKG